MRIEPGAQLGPYEIVGALGAAGMGEVYRARDSRLGREVAIKVLPTAFASDDDRLRRFEQEARTAGLLNHPNILTIYDVGMHHSHPYIVSELLAGETLRARLQHGALPPRKTVDLALQIAYGMKDGLIDLAVPMNYARETDERVRGWFDGWIRWEKRHTHGRQLAVGIGAYRNTPDDILDQIARVRRVDGSHRAYGVSFFSYASPQQPAEGINNDASAAAAGPRPSAEQLAFLAEGSGQKPAPFARPAPVPPMPWIDRPQTGWIAGIVRDPDAPADTVRVKIKGSGFALFRRAKRVETDGNGYFGLTNVKPGRYRVWLEGDDVDGSSAEVIVEAGKVARADLRLSKATH